MRASARLALALLTAASLDAAPQRDVPVSSGGDHATRPLSYVEARPIVERVAPGLAAVLAARPDAERETAWRTWLSERDAAIRARLERGEEDSLVNLLRYGTSFTALPRVSNGGATPGDAARIIAGRMDDLFAAAAAPDGDERLALVRQLFARRGIDPATDTGRDRARAYLLALMMRAADETRAYARELAVGRTQGRGELAVRSTLFRDRGLSSDTSLRPDFAIARALEELRGRGELAGPVRRAAIVGPGLDFTDKAEGFDFYPQQATQPFLLVEALVRTGLSQLDGLSVATFDISPRVNAHLRAAVRRADAGDEYTFVLPRDRSQMWAPGLASFWSRAGLSIGAETSGVTPPPGVDARTLRVRPAVVSSLDVHDLDIVVERLDLPDGERFDLMVATNVLLYYDVLEQSLALANLAAMLRPGSMLLSNTVLVELPNTPIRSIGHTDAIYSDEPDDRDQIVWYRRQ